MGKSAGKKKQKWKSLELEPAACTEESQTPEPPPQQQHPFLKIINKSMDAIISTNKAKEPRSVYLYRSSQAVCVPPTSAPSQYTGAPIQYGPNKWTGPTSHPQHTTTSQDQATRYPPSQDQPQSQDATPHYILVQDQSPQFVPKPDFSPQYTGSEEVYHGASPGVEYVTEYVTSSGTDYTQSYPVQYVSPGQEYSPATCTPPAPEYLAGSPQYLVAGPEYTPVHAVPGAHGVTRPSGLVEYPQPPPVTGVTRPSGLVEYLSVVPAPAAPSLVEYPAAAQVPTPPGVAHYVSTAPVPEHPATTQTFSSQPPTTSAEYQPVQYVPYYFYYPVPVQTTEPETEAVIKPRSQALVQTQQSSSSSTSCDSCFPRAERSRGGRRRRRKRGESEGKLEKMSTTALADVDSGYLNGEESSSEQSSCRGEADVVDSGMEVEQEITDLLIHQVKNPGIVDVQFGEVAEILEQLRHAEIEERVEKLKEREEMQEEELEETEIDRECEEDVGKQEECDVDSTEESKTVESLAPLEAERKVGQHSHVNKSSKKKDKKNKKKKSKKTVSLVTTELEVESQEHTNELISEVKEAKRAVDEIVELTLEDSKENIVVLENELGNTTININDLVDSDKVIKHVMTAKTTEEDSLDKDIKDKLVKEVEMVEKAVLANKWTEVNVSRKKKSHANNANLSHTKKDNKTVPMTKKHSEKSLKSVPEPKGSQLKENQDVNVNISTPLKTNKLESSVKSTQPLKEIKELFFHEKPVEIVELARPDLDEKVPKKRIRQKAKSKRAFLSESKKLPQQNTSSLPQEKSWDDLAFTPLPFLVFQPFGSFLHEQSGKDVDELEEWQRIVAPPIGLSVRAGGSCTPCPLEEDLVRQKVILRRERMEARPVTRPLVMIREQLRPGGMVGGKRETLLQQAVPGPRMKYSQGCRTGPLGVARRVVPPLCLTRRLTVF